MPSRKTKKFRRDRTEISCCLKYSIFSVNVVCWVIFTPTKHCLLFSPWTTNIFLSQICGLCLLSVGVWALNEKNVFSNLTSNLLYDPAFVLIVSGSVTFLIGKKTLKIVVVVDWEMIHVFQDLLDVLDHLEKILFYYRL